MLNLEQAKALFAREAVFLGGNDGVPVSRAMELFGEKATQFAARLSFVRNGQTQIVYSSFFGLGDYQIQYLTYRGFLQAATYANALEIKKKEQEKAAASS